MHLQCLCFLDLHGLLCLLLVYFIAPQGAWNGDWHHLEILDHEPVASIFKVIMMQVVLNLEKAEIKIPLYPYYVLKKRQKSNHIKMTSMVTIITMVNVLMYSPLVHRPLPSN